MGSFKSKLFIFFLENRNLFRFKLGRRPEVTWDTSIPELRAKTEKSAKMFGKIPKDIEITPLDIDGMYAEWLSFHGVKEDSAILYFHGGGYCIGSPPSHRTHISKFVKGTGIRALSFDYRLAPENQFPAALDDALKAYNFLMDSGYPPEKIGFIGDSAGGGLALATLLALKENNIGLPAAVSVMSPWTDLKCTGESLIRNARVDTISWKESWTVFSKYYCREQDPASPLISPLYGDLSGLPPLQIHVGSYETLLDDSKRFYEKARAAGTKAEIIIGEGLFHCYPVCSPMFPEAKEAMDKINNFITYHLK